MKIMKRSTGLTAIMVSLPILSTACLNEEESETSLASNLPALIEENDTTLNQIAELSVGDVEVYFFESTDGDTLDTIQVGSLGTPPISPVTLRSSIEAYERQGLAAFRKRLDQVESNMAVVRANSRAVENEVDWFQSTFCSSSFGISSPDATRTLFHGPFNNVNRMGTAFANYSDSSGALSAEVSTFGFFDTNWRRQSFNVSPGQWLVKTKGSLSDQNPNNKFDWSAGLSASHAGRRGMCTHMSLTKPN